MIKDYEAYLFDWDGTLAQTLAVWLPVVHDILRSYGGEVSDKIVVRQIFGRPRQGFEELGVPADEVQGVLEQLVERAQQAVPTAPLYPGVQELLSLLQKQDKHLAVITAASAVIIDKTFQHHNLQGVFDMVVTGSDIKKHKPDPEGIVRTLEQLHVAKEKAVMLGDSEKDILAAHNAGIDSILFYPPEHEAFHTLSELTAENPTYVLRSWRELIDQLQ